MGTGSRSPGYIILNYQKKGGVTDNFCYCTGSDIDLNLEAVDDQVFGEKSVCDLISILMKYIINYIINLLYPE